MISSQTHLTQAAHLDELRAKGAITVHLNGHAIALFLYGERVYAIDNRCPHMGFPLDKGTVKGGILTCHWHHARFDLASGGTFDLWADDVDTFPVEIRDEMVWVDLSGRANTLEHLMNRLRDGLERNISLVIAKSVIGLLKQGVEPAIPFREGVIFGARYRQEGWGRGLTTHTCVMNLISFLGPEDHPRALYHGLSDVANDTENMAPRFPIRPLPAKTADISTLKRWYRQFVEVRDTEGAERCIVSAIRSGATLEEMADMMFAAATDHRYIDLGHALDFTNKAFEALDIIGPKHAETILPSLVPDYTNAARMEESNAWRYPVDLIAILEETFAQLPEALKQGQNSYDAETPHNDELIATLLSDDPQAIVEALIHALQRGVTEEQLASVVTCAAIRRIAHFHTSNEFGDWDTALHTFTFANAVHQGLRRVNSFNLLRGVFDAAMSVYLDRFLNIPRARVPEPDATTHDPTALLEELTELLNHQQQVNQAGNLVAQHLYHHGDANRLMALLGRLLLREDRNFHTIQCVEAAFQQYRLLQGHPSANYALIAAARYLAAHAPTMRAQGQTYQIANRLARGERLFEGD